MSWVAIPEALGDDPRLDDLGDAALAAIVRMYCYASKHETDGVITPTRAAKLASPEAIEGLRKVGIIVVGDHGVRIVDFLRHNLCHEQREHNREKAAERVRRFRNASCNAVTPPVTNAVRNAVCNATDRTGPDRTEQRPERTGNQDHNRDPDPPSAGASASPPARARTKREIHPLRQEYLKDFHDAHKAATGGRVYEWTGRERAALDRYCSEIKPDVWKAACAAYSSRSVEWLFRNGQAPDLGSFYRNLNAFAAAAPTAPSGPVPGGMLDTAQRALANLKRMQSHGVA